MPLDELLARLPEGWHLAVYRGRRYGVTKRTGAGGRRVTLYAEELGGTDIVSANVYRTSAGDLLRACEMPDAKVLAFLDGWQPLDTARAAGP